ncbi:MAG: hypothetical protein D6701_03105 [Gemmatimonadetes bacterium]|nr:MAG: hypothetical protein D6701_03105 [Gemmatimonadota bacterium]
MINRLKTFAVAAAVGALLIVPSGARAQVDFDLSLAGGTALPVGDLADGWKVGGNISVGGSFWISDNFAVRPEFVLDILSGDKVGQADQMPDLNLWHLGVVGELALTERGADGLSFTINGGGGYTWMDSDKLSGNAGSPDFSEWYWHLKGGAEVGWNAGGGVHVGVNASVIATFADDTDTAFFQTANPAFVPFSTAVSLPITGFIRISF